MANIKIEIREEFYQCLCGKYLEIFWISVSLAWKIIHLKTFKLTHVYTEMKT